MVSIQEDLKVKAERFKARAKETDDPKARERVDKIVEDIEAKMVEHGPPLQQER